MKSLIPLQNKYNLIQEALVNPAGMMGSFSGNAVAGTTPGATSANNDNTKINTLKGEIDKVSPIKVGELEAKYKTDPAGVKQNLTEIIDKLIEELKSKNPALHSKLAAAAATGDMGELQKLLIQNLPDVQTLQQTIKEELGAYYEPVPSTGDDASKGPSLLSKIAKGLGSLVNWFKSHPSVIPGVVGLMAAGPLGMVALPLIAKALTKGTTGSSYGSSGKESGMTFIDIMLDKDQTEKLSQILKRPGWDRSRPLSTLNINGILDSTVIQDLKKDPYLIANITDQFQGEYQIKYKDNKFIIIPIAIGINIAETPAIKTKFNVVANKALKNFNHTNG